MTTPGFVGKIAHVNLTTREVTLIDTDNYVEWLGGHGLASALFWDWCEDMTVGPFDPKNLIVLVNPVLMEAWGEPEEVGEGCLSCPGITVPITRKPWVRVRYFDLDGDEWEIESDGLLGRCLQHEIDHLDGKTLFETCSPDVRLTALGAYEKAKAAGAKPGDVGID